MTLLQALVALALFAPGAVAPRAGLDVTRLSLFSTAAFAVGLVASFWGGGFVARFGSLRVASFCALVTALSMGLASLGQNWALVCAGLAVGLAAGPETPASSALLGRLVTTQQRAFVFSIRQTGNQIGAIAGSLALPTIAVLFSPAWSYAAVAVFALLAIVMFEALGPAYASATAPLPQLGVHARLQLVRSDRRISALAFVSMPYSAMQVALNTCFVSFGAFELGLSHVEAGVALALAQAGGLFGRLGWGYLASRFCSARVILIATGIGMASCASLFGLYGAGLGKPMQFVLSALFGLTASGWNGVFVSEVARLAPPDRIAETTGAVLTASFGGLLLAPLLITAVASLADLGGAFIVLAVLVMIGVTALFRDRADERP